MKRIWRIDILARLLIPLVVVPILGLSARSHEADGALQRARLAMNAQEPVAAAASLSKAAEHLPSRPELWEIAGHQALAGGEALTAIDHFHKAAEQGSLSGEGYLALGESQQLAGDILAAVEAWSEGLELYSADAEMLTLRGQAYRELGDFPAAVADLKALTSLEPGNADARYQLGLLLAATQPEAASAHLVQAAEFDESYTERVQSLRSAIRRALFADEMAYTFVLIGQSLASLGEWDLAAEAFKNATLQDENYAEAWAYLGEARGQLGEDGLSELQTALALNPDSLAGNVFMGLHWRREGQHELALVYLHAAASLDPENPATQVDIGRTLFKLGDLNKALSYYQRATELAERDATYWNLLAEFSIFNEVYVEEVGLPAARQATLLDPDDPAALALIGQAYFLLQENLTAERFLKRAIEADADYAPAHLYLGIYYLSSGDREKAKQELSLAAALSPESSTGEQAQRLLENYFPSHKNSPTTITLANIIRYAKISQLLIKSLLELRKQPVKTTQNTSLLILLLLLSAACSSVSFRGISPENGILFEDDFSNPFSGWDRYEEAHGRTDYEDGSYRITIQDTMSFFWATPSRNFTDVSIEVDTQKLSGEDNFHGIVCRYQDTDNFYILAISGDGLFGIFKRKGGSDPILTGMDIMEGSEAIHQDGQSNHLHADCVGSTLTLYINGEKAISVEDGEFKSGEVGVILSTYEIPDIEILFDNFVVRQPESNE